MLDGEAATPALIDRAMAALEAELAPLPDLTHAAATKRHLAVVLGSRSICTALATAEVTHAR